MIWIPIVILLIATGALAYAVFELEKRRRERADALQETLDGLLERMTFYDAFQEAFWSAAKKKAVSKMQDVAGSDIGITMKAFKNTSQ